MKILLRTALLCVLLVSACSKNPNDVKSSYNITAGFDDELKYFECRLNVRWTNNSLSNVDSIPFIFYGSPEDSLVKGVRVNGKPAEFTYMGEGADVNGFYVSVPPVRPGKSVAVEMDFNTYEDDYFRDNLLFYDNDFPVIPYCGPDGFNLHWRQHSDFEVTVTVPDSYNIAPTGVISFVTEDDGKTTYNTWAEDVPYYGIVLLWEEIQMMESEASGVGIRTFYFPQDSLWAPRLTGYAEDIISFYTSELGFFPSPTVSIIPGYHLPYGGWPVCPNVIGIHMGLDRKPESHAHWITAHELGHQYWGYNYSMNPTDYPGWIGIALGIYTDRMYARQAGLDVDYDAYFYEDYVEAVEEGVNTTIMRTVEELDNEGIDWNNIIKHGKGWAVIRMLENEIGEEAFRRAYDLYLERSGGQNLTAEDFRLACEEASGPESDLSDFFHTWLYTDDYLEYAVKDFETSPSEEGWVVSFTLEKVGKAGAGPVDILYYSESGESFTKTYDTGGVSLTVEEPLPFRPDRIEADPAGKLPFINRPRASAVIN